MSAYSHFAVLVAARATLIGLLVCGAAYLLLQTQLYASALVLGLLAVAITADLASKVARTDRTLESAMAAVLCGDEHIPHPDGRTFVRSLSQLERAAAVYSTVRFQQQQRIAYLQTLLDTAPVALLVAQRAGRISAQNNSARQLLNALADDLQLLNQGAGLAPGARQILQLRDGRRLLASAAQFSVPGGEPELLLSLQRISGELDAVELLAWQDMARVLTHEMMNSLTPIASLSESLETLLRRAQQTNAAAALAEVTAALEVIKRRSLGLTSFVERYRKVVDLPQPQLETIDAAAVISGIQQLMGPRFKEDFGILYRTVVVPPSLQFAGDPQLLEQAMINLLRNASDAVAGVSQPEIELRCELCEQRILLTVRDNGAGLPAESHEQIFVPFFTTKPGGSGIGLSLARQIAVAHGGTLEVQAAAPKGSLFIMNLPLQQAISTADNQHLANSLQP